MDDSRPDASRPVEFRLCQACRRIHGAGSTCPTCRTPLTLVDETFFLGMDLGKYRIEEVLGRGGMGVVFRAVHGALGRAVALKVLLPEPDGNTGGSNRFLREARLLAGLKHPAIVEIYDCDVSDWGVPYYVMELLPGRTLRALLLEPDSPGTLPAYLGLLRDVAAGLQYAHDRGIIHRDLKPENILVQEEGGSLRGKLLDFGIAKSFLAGSETTLTAASMMPGTPRYLAPEQIHGGELGPALDQFALGLVVAEILLGRPLREGMTLSEILSERISPALRNTGPLRAFPRRLRNALFRATDMDPERRYPSVTAFMDDLEAALEGVPSFERPTRIVDRGTVAPGTQRAMVRPGRPSRLRAWSLGGAILLTVSVLAWLGGGRLGRRSHPVHRPPLLDETSELGSPADAVRLLGFDRSQVLLQGSGCLYVLDKDPAVPLTRIPLAPGDALLGATPEGGYFLQTAHGVELHQPGEKNPRPWMVPLLARGPLILSPGATWAGFSDGGLLRVFHRTDATWRPMGTYPIGSGGTHALLALGDRYLAVLVAGRLRVYDLLQDRRILETAVEDPGLRTMAVDDLTGRVALGGWSDQVRLYDPSGAPPVSIPHQGQVEALAFIPDAPTLVIAGEGGLQLWRPGQGAVGSWSRQGASLQGLRFQGGRLLAFDPSLKRLRMFAYHGLPLGPPIQVVPREIWAMAPDPNGQALFVGAGGADGALRRYDLDSGKIQDFPLHEQGITSLVAAGGRLASASDDRTIAIWRLPSMEVLWRSRAHGFLVNQLRLVGNPPALWSSSSDGTLKRWSWPDLGLQETLSTERIFGKRYACHALWVSPHGNRAVVGTWNHELLVLDRRGGGWRGETLPIASSVIYAIASLPSSSLLVMVGIDFPAGIYVYDLETRQLYEIPHGGASLYTVVPGSAPDEALLFGEGVAMRLQIRRSKEGGLEYALRTSFASDLGVADAAVKLPHRSDIAVGNGEGRVFLVAPGDIGGSEAMTGHLAGPPRAEGAESGTGIATRK